MTVKLKTTTITAKFTFTIIMLLGFTIASAQVGIFECYNDFLVNEVVSYDDYVTTSNNFGSFKVTFVDDSGNKEKVEVDKQKMWGYRRSDGAILRVDKKNRPNVILAKGTIVVYGNYSTTISNNVAKIESTEYVPRISKGLNSDMVVMNKKNLKRMLAGDPVALKKLKETSINYQDLIYFIHEFNKSEIPAD